MESFKFMRGEGGGGGAIFVDSEDYAVSLGCNFVDMIFVP